MLKATLDALAPRAAAALHRRLAWHAAVGAHEVATTLGAPSLSQLSRQLADAQASATAGEPVRREQSEPLPLDLTLTRTLTAALTLTHSLPR